MVLHGTVWSGAPSERKGQRWCHAIPYDTLFHSIARLQRWSWYPCALKILNRAGSRSQTSSAGWKGTTVACLRVSRCDVSRCRTTPACCAYWGGGCVFPSPGLVGRWDRPLLLLLLLVLAVGSGVDGAVVVVLSCCRCWPCGVGVL